MFTIRQLNLFKLRKKGGFMALNNKIARRSYHSIPFVDLYTKTIGQVLSKQYFENLKKKHPGIDLLSQDRLQCTLQILQKFGISAEDACHDPHVFTMNPITMDNYGEILKECGFVKILPNHIIRYHTLVKSRTIARLKKENLLREDLNLEEVLLNYFHEWTEDKILQRFSDSNTNIVTVRMSVLQKFLNWKLGVTPEEFAKYCKNYTPFRHKPMSDVQEAIDLALNVLKFEVAGIKRNGFVISADPVNTKLILDNVKSLASLDIREVIKIEPAILKNNYNSILEIQRLLEEYEISEEAERKCFKIYCMSPKTVNERLSELRNLKEYQILKTNTRVLSMVVYQRKLMNRLEKIQAAKKQCYSLNHLVSSRKIFDSYISSFGDKVGGRDVTTLISLSLLIKSSDNQLRQNPEVKLVLQKLKRHKYWLHAALTVIDENIQFLKKKFNDDVIFNNCQLLLYPASEIENYIEFLLSMKSGTNIKVGNLQLDATYNNINYRILNDDQILSLILYEIEKKYHFSGDGIWTRLDGLSADAQAS